MKNKRGWIRIAEASIAILIVMSAILILIAGKKQPDISKEVYEKQSQILNLIIENSTLRQDILENKLNKVNKEILSMMPFNWDFSTNICDIDRICPNQQYVYDREVFAMERVVASTLTTHPDKPKKLKFFVWMKN